MLQNLKVDIIYHLVPSDFEMEFNLGGCCRMRLLTEKTQDRKSFVNSLAKSVDRSQVIIICGPLFSESGLISTVASAIGKSLSVVDTAKFSINSSEEIRIIDGSVPLVSKDGYFGGCVIESGPQSIILLTENKMLRKSIMKNLIHPYIEELSIAPQNRQAASAADQQYITNDTAKLPVEEPHDEENGEYIFDTAPTSPEEQVPIQDKDIPSDIPFIFDDIEDDKNDTPYEQTMDASEEDSMFLSEVCEPDLTDYSEYSYGPESEEFNMAMITEPERPERQRLNFGIFILTIFLLLVVAALCFFVFVLPHIKGVSLSQYIQDTFLLSANRFGLFRF